MFVISSPCAVMDQMKLKGITHLTKILEKVLLAGLQVLVSTCVNASSLVEPP